MWKLTAEVQHYHKEVLHKKENNNVDFIETERA